MARGPCHSSGGGAIFAGGAPPPWRILTHERHWGGALSAVKYPSAPARTPPPRTARRVLPAAVWWRHHLPAAVGDGLSLLAQPEDEEFVAQAEQARRLHPDDRHALGDEGHQRLQQPSRLALRLVDLASGEIRAPAAQSRRA